VEGGAKTHEFFIRQKLFQKVLCFVSPTPRSEGLPWVLTMETIKAQLHLITSMPISEDRYFEFEPK
jgi:riboflavin biosynthesis pyrimidine reductase